MSTPQMHPGTPPKTMPVTADNYTQAQIESAVVALMSRLSPVGKFDAAQARVVAQLLGSDVNDPVTGIPPGASLAGNADFERMVIDKAPALRAETNDPATLATLDRFAAQQNPTGSGVTAQPGQFGGQPIWAGSRDTAGSGHALSDANSRDGSSGTYSGSLGTVTAHNYADTPFARTGLSFSTFTALRAQGFNETNIVHAAQDAGRAGFDVNNKRIAADFAVLDRDDGKRRDERNALFEKFDEEWEKDEHIQKLATAYGNAKTDQERAEVKAQMLRRGQEISSKTGLHQHMETMPTPAAKESGQRLESDKIEQRFQDSIRSYTHGNKADAEAVTETIKKFNYNPQDAEARKKYQALEEAAGGDRRKRLALAQIKHALAKDAKLKAGQMKSNEVKEATNATHTQTQDDTLASLNDELGPTQKAEAPKPAKTSTKIARNEGAKVKGAKGPTRPSETGTAEARPAAAPAPAG